MSRILKLSPDAISGIQSSKRITSLQGVVLALLENSLDAGSNNVEISVDFRRGCCTVEDNGTGIPSAEFLETGGLGNMYHTSKHLANGADERHGSTGTYLASLGALSLLSITSKLTESNDCATLTIHQGKVIARLVPASASHDLILSPTHGTRVTVRDLFGNMPVRVKQRAFASDSGSDDEKAWHELKHGIAALLLAWPTPCCVKVRDLNLESRKIHLTAQHPSISHTLTEKSLKQLTGGGVKFDLKDVLPVLFQSNFAPAESRTQWVPVSAASSTISIKGSICLDPAPTRACQFISLGVHPCVAKDGYADVYEAVNKVFSNSNFGALEDDSFDVGDEEKQRRKRDQRFKQDGTTRKQMQGRKGVDRWPMFVLQAKFKNRRTESDRTSERSLKALMDILEAAVREWLAANHFRPKEKRQKKVRGGEQSPGSVSSRGTSGHTTPVMMTPNTKRVSEPGTVSTSKKRKILDTSGRLRPVDQEPIGTTRPMTADFSTWSRIKSGKHAFYDDIWADKAPHTAPGGRIGSLPAPVPPKKMPFELPTLEAGEISVRQKKVGAGNPTILFNHTKLASGANLDFDYQLSSDDFGSVDSEILLAVTEKAEKESESDLPNETLVEWTDPNTKRTYKVNARTGVVLPVGHKLPSGP